MEHSIFPIAGAVLILLEVAGVIIKKDKQILPLGGSHSAQMAVVFGLAFVFNEVLRAFH